MLDLKANPEVGLLLCPDFYPKSDVEFSKTTYTEVNTKTYQYLPKKGVSKYAMMFSSLENYPANDALLFSILCRILKINRGKKHRISDPLHGICLA